MSLDPLQLAQSLERVVVRNDQRKYYRLVRSDRWYGGICTSDCCGCNLRCVFCWSGKPRDDPASVGRFYTPEQVANALVRCARKRGFRQVRISGNEPTIGREHLLKVLELIDSTSLRFILETNGILIGYDKGYARDLSKFSCLHVRVSIKGATPEEFAKLTLAKPEFFEYQITALENLLDAGVSCHPCAMLSFSTEENVKKLLKMLLEIDPVLVREFEEEYVFLYPHVKKRLKQYGIKPLVAYSPSCIPEELI